jgi:hypothetical protein
LRLLSDKTTRDMRTKILLLGIIALLLTSSNIIAQDKIHKRNQEIIDCKVKEIGTESIKYTLPDYPDDVLFAIDKDKILKVVFKDGHEIEFMKELSNPENYIDNKKNAIKLDFISPLTGNTTFTFEHSLRPGRSIEAGLGIIGLGYKPGDRKSTGAFIRFGYKFIKSPDFYISKMRYSHILKGGYVKPEVTFGYYSEKDSHFNHETNSNTTSNEQIFTATIHIVLGKQWILDNAFLIDFFGGIGYGFDDSNESYQYSHIMASWDFPLSFSGGLKVGYLFK